MKKKLEINRKSEIEELLEEIKSKSVLKLIEEGYSLEEISYLCRAILMPLKELAEFIEIYDTSRPRVDELKFVDDLCQKYHTDKKTLTARIREVRRINKFRKESEVPKR